jgi:hypothetical protein
MKTPTKSVNTTVPTKTPTVAKAIFVAVFMSGARTRREGDQFAVQFSPVEISLQLCARRVWIPPW